MSNDEFIKFLFLFIVTLTIHNSIKICLKQSNILF
uniref:Uncharacterized protein n=1 Tax=viral metagenome TaxID=1070528 RepID=A0A6C0CZB1_9ZZZZ